MQDQYKEVLIAIIAVITLFLLLAGIIILFLLRYQRKKFQYQREVSQMQQQFQQEILQAQLEIQESTFNNISREIHDNVGQLLSLAKIQLNIMYQSEQLNKTMLLDVKENVGKAMGDLRDIAKSLSGERMQQIGLSQNIQQEIERINRSNVVKASFQVDGEPFKLNDQKQLIIFRILQEGIQNIFKHAEATLITVLLHYSVKSLELTIHDNGKGFDADNKNTTGLGLQNIISRAALIGGSAIVSSTVNNGTQIKLIIAHE